MEDGIQQVKMVATKLEHGTVCDTFFNLVGNCFKIEEGIEALKGNVAERDEEECVQAISPPPLILKESLYSCR